MKVCVSSYGPTLESKVQPVFGRCEYLIFADPVSMASEVVPNPFASMSESAGVESAELVIGKGATTLLTAQVGTKARQVLEAAGVEIMAIKGGTVREAVESCR
jgi:predicted Fe-Mo cluster-binding NifX family protein